MSSLLLQVKPAQRKVRRQTADRKRAPEAYALSRGMRARRAEIRLVGHR